MSLESEWEFFMKSGVVEASTPTTQSAVYPKPSELYFSTQTFIAQLNRNVNLTDLFWTLETIPYDVYSQGICKKQMKFTSLSEAEVDALMLRLQDHKLSHVQLIRRVQTAEKFKDIRKVSIGLSKKDLFPNRVKPKGAFFNCLVLNLRVQVDDERFKDYHVKVFNTGNIEIPGIQDSSHVGLIMDVLEKSIRRVHPIARVPESKIVLINSHFNIRFNVNRDKLYTLLRQTHNVSAVYDPCSYPGVQCKLYYTPENEIVTRPLQYQSSSVSVMIFRTGSVLIVGKCNEVVIRGIYHFLNCIFSEHYAEVADGTTEHEKEPKSEKKPKKLVIKK